MEGEGGKGLAVGSYELFAVAIPIFVFERICQKFQPAGCVPNEFRTGAY